MNYKPLNDFINNATRDYNTYPSSFGDISDAYKEKFGDKKWIGQMVRDVKGILPPSERGLKKGSEGYKEANREYSSARRQIERHASGQYKSFDKGTQAKLEEIGRTLEPIKKDAPPDGLTITVEFGAPEDKGHAPRTREFTVHMPYNIAVQYINQAQPQYGPLFSAYFNEDNFEDEDDQGEKTYGEGGDYEADIYSVA